MLEPRPLEYQTPRTTDSPLRQLTSRHAIGNGGACLVLSFFFPLGRWILIEFDGRRLTTFIVGAIAAWYMVAGIVYVIGGVKVIRPNRFWEKILMASSCIHSVVILVLTFFVIFGLIVGSLLPARSSHDAVIGSIVCLAYCAVHLIAFGRGFVLARKVRNEAYQWDTNA